MNAIKDAISVLGSVTNFARALGVTPQAVCFWRDGQRQIPADKCPLIERITDGAVRCESLRPDVDWNYIRSTEPAIATAAKPVVEAIAQLEPLFISAQRRQGGRREKLPTTRVV